MTEQTVAYLREQAARCRRLAAATYDQQTHDSLNRSAEEFDDEAARRDSEVDGCAVGQPAADDPDR